MNELYTALIIAFVCGGIGFVGYVIGVVQQASEFDKQVARYVLVA